MSQPPLKALHYFCVAAHSLSFKQAADELSVTPGAISQQVKALEDWLGLPLFLRGARQVTLTEAGSSYYRRVYPLLSELLGVTVSMQRINRTRTVRLTLPPGFAMIRFGPQLKAFREVHPDIELQLHASSLLSTLDGSDHDLAIRYLPEADQRFDCTGLGNLEVMAVCSPEYRSQHPGLATGNLDGCTLLHDHLHQDWQRMIQQAGLTGRPLDNLYSDHSTLALQAAESHLGVWLTDQILGAPALEAGRLGPVFETTLPARRHLFLVHNRQAPLSAVATTVKQWILEHFRLSSAPHR
ncbi:LysR family transcriptional regulator [Marinobacter halodurans]|uniref:LysR family transcriptional regulator n=1 Tax=Marinobacter halodurans TaxID=2528979 RepID=A0ABY1ZVC6_9GAMM|nr:LysR substrate-binding domain-containing protein [Marinobacter halodurans]TBW59603.1 LysR family transcriptional regulator [Marinobacter halodurans]